MLFEIQKMEGIGRFGLINFSNPIETPTLLCLQERYSNKLSSGIKKPILETLSKEYPFIFTKDLDKECFKASHNVSASESFPRCYLYSSLQIQEKSKENLTHIHDFFPEKYQKTLKRNDAFHIVPWDLPEIFLEAFFFIISPPSSNTVKIGIISVQL